MSDGVTVLPENIRKNLAKCSEHQQLTCLECGYSGLMGVVRTQRKILYGKVFWPLVIAFVVLSQYWWFMMTTQSGQLMMMRHLSDPEAYPVMVWLDFLVEAIFGHMPGWLWAIPAFIVAKIFIKKLEYLQCPNCERELVKR